MVAGYILYRVKQPPKIPLIVNMGLWLVSLFTLVIVIFGVGGGQLSRIATSFYVSLGHTGNHDTFLFAFLLYILMLLPSLPHACVAFENSIVYVSF